MHQHMRSMCLAPTTTACGRRRGDRGRRARGGVVTTASGERPATSTSRRTVGIVGLAVGVLGSSLSNARASGGDGGKTFAVETTRYVIANVPSYFEEIDLGESDAAAAYETLLRDRRFGLAGNTVTLSAQTASSGGPKSLADIGSVDDVAARLVSTENARSRGAAKATLRSAETRLDSDGVRYYEIVYEKSVLGVRRVLQTTLALDVDASSGASTLYTLTAEQDRERYDADAEAMRALGAGFKILRPGE